MPTRARGARTRTAKGALCRHAVGRRGHLAGGVMGPLTQASPSLKRPHNARGAPSGAESKAAARAHEPRCNHVGETKAAARARGTAIASVGAWGPK